MLLSESNYLLLLDGTVQYRIPRWHRRYSWGNKEINRLFSDLLAVAESGDQHYGGSMITVLQDDSGPLATFFQVVDGQQRLTTISIILACIAEKLEPEGQVGYGHMM